MTAIIVARQPGRVAVLLNPGAPAAAQRAVVVREGGPPPTIAAPAASLLMQGDDWDWADEPLTPAVAAQLSLAGDDLLPPPPDLAPVSRAYNPDEPREPAGSPAGGQWAGGGGGGGAVGVAPVLATRQPRPELLADKEERKAVTVKDAADLNHLPVEDYKRAVEANLAKVLAASDVRVQVSPGVLEEILRTGQFKTAFDRKVPEGRPSDYRKVRDRQEQDKFSIPPGAKKDDRPVYGYAATPGHQPHPGLEQYGSVALELKPSVKDRATFTVGDSLGINNQLPSPVGRPHWTSAEYRDIPEGRTSDPLHLHEASALKGSEYVELQVHGGVRATDIARVVFSAPPHPQTLAAVERAGLPHAEYAAHVSAYPHHGPVPAGEIAALEAHQANRAEYVSTAHGGRMGPAENPERARLFASLDATHAPAFAAAAANLARYRRGER